MSIKSRADYAGVNHQAISVTAIYSPHSKSLNPNITPDPASSYAILQSHAHPEKNRAPFTGKVFVKDTVPNAESSPNKKNEN
jgi:hypothetical protein